MATTACREERFLAVRQAMTAVDGSTVRVEHVDVQVGLQPGSGHTRNAPQFILKCSSTATREKVASSSAAH
jgi:hypothetical protein